MMLVRALRMGYYGDKRRRAGDEFLMDEDAFRLEKDENGKDTDNFVMDPETDEPAMPTWVELIEANYKMAGSGKKNPPKGKGGKGVPQDQSDADHADPAGRPLDSGKKNKYQHGGTSVADPLTASTDRVPRTQDQEVI